MASENPKIEKSSDYERTPEGWQRLWTVEMKGSEEFLKDWWERAEKINKRYRDDEPKKDPDEQSVNLFHANVETQKSVIYGQVPRVSVKRRHADAGDDAARVAAEGLQRLLNTDIEQDDDTYTEALEMALSDRLIVGLGSVRLRYEVETEEQEEVPAITEPCECEGEDQECPACQGSGQVELAPAYTPPPKLKDEDVEVDYVYWRDERWSPCRNWNDVRWRAWKAEMTRDALHERFDRVLGPVEVDNLPLRGTRKDGDAEGIEQDPWARAEVWEIWSKDHEKVFYWIEGASKILDVVDDPLDLEGFFPAPRPMFANLTTSKLIPTPDYLLAQDLYEEIDTVSTRITKLERAIKAVGVYDKTSSELKTLLSEAYDLDMIPVDNFSLFAQQGGLKSVVDWLPLEMFVAALDKLREYRAELIQLLYQVTGMSDIMRGQSSKQTTATEQAIKAKFASTRMQWFQNEFARFASDTLSIKAQIISKHFDPQTIVKRSNMEFMSPQDQQYIPQAIEIIKSELGQYRIEVQPESVSMVDYAAVKQERSEMLMAVATYLQSAMPIMQAAPPMGTMLLQILQWAMAGFRGAGTVEGVIDQGVVQFQQFLQQKASQPPQPDPTEMLKLQGEKMKIEGQMALGQEKIRAMREKSMVDRQKAMMDLAAQREKIRMDGQKAAQDAAVAQRKGEIDLDVSSRKAQLQLQTEAVKAAQAATQPKTPEA